MKKYLIALALVSSPAFAAECSSIWIFKDHVPCTDSRNGYDVSSSSVSSDNAPAIVLTTHGKTDPRKSCETRVAEINAQGARTGEGRELIKVDENSPDKNWLGEMTYTYICSVRALRFAPKKTGPACPLEESYNQRKGGTEVDLPENATCLSCDQFNGNANKKAECLVKNIKTFLSSEQAPDRLDIRPDDVTAVREAVKQLVNLNKTFPVPALESVENQQVVSSYLQKPETK